VKSRTSTHPRERACWLSMLARCYDSNAVSFSRYGARGITVCASWRGDGGLERFVSDLGPRPSLSHSLDRERNEDGYWCGHCGDCQAQGQRANCRWATREEQNRNRSVSRFVTIDGQAKTVADWAELVGISETAFVQRLRSGQTGAGLLAPPRKLTHGRHRTRKLEATS
jgi:hypothetical protein